jgi:hypothetical protein
VIGGDGFVRGCALRDVQGKPLLYPFLEACAPRWTYPKLAEGIAAPMRHAAIETRVIRIDLATMAPNDTQH